MRERIRRMSGWLSAFLVMVFVLLQVSGCGSGQGTRDVPVRTEETYTLLHGEGKTPVQEAGAVGEPDGDMLSSDESQMPVQEAGTTESSDEDIFADLKTEAGAFPVTEESEVPRTEERENFRTEESEAPRTGEQENFRTEESEALKTGEWEDFKTGESADAGLIVEEGESYTSKEEVALYLHIFGKLPSNFITKKEAEVLGWKKEPGETGELQNVAPGKSIGGDRFGNYEKLLPEKKGRKYFECDINYVKGKRGAERIIYSNDGLIFYTGDHYKTFEKLY